MRTKFLGLDTSTQSITATIIDCSDGSANSLSVNFESDLPQYKTRAGAVSNPKNPLEVWSYPSMWLDGLDMLFDKLSKAFDLSEIAAVCGSGQQHASVWLNSTGVFTELEKAPKGKLGDILKGYLSRERAPVWLDASTSSECAEITAVAGGDAYVLAATGSVETERFTGAQIRKIYLKEPEVYKATKRIHLNSSFICSVLSASDAPIDFGDGAGMNLTDIRRHVWDKTMLNATAPNLLSKLPILTDSKSVVGKISEYFCRNYEFSKDAKVCIFTGDNPSSLVGIGASQAGNAAISLGTSDTFFCSNKNYAPVANAHVFGNPSGGFMNLICFRNGSLARESLKNKLKVDWKFFDVSSFENFAPANDGKFAIPFYVDEISPKTHSSKPEFFGVEKPYKDKAECVRIFIEGQFMNMFLQAKKMNASPSKIILTGGASKSGGIAQTIADIFNAEVYKLSKSVNSAALGAAMRAAEICGSFPMKLLEDKFCSRELFKKPKHPKVYAEKIASFSKILEKFTGKQF